MNLEIAATSPSGLLTLLGMRGIGPQAAERLTRRFGTLAALRAASPQDLEGTVSSTARVSLQDTTAWQEAIDRAQKIIAEAERRRVDIVTAADDRYPDWLRAIPDRPQVLFVRGTLRPGRRYVACIGTREPSRFGEEVARRIVPVLAERNWGIVSGLAIGVDALAHRAALDNGAYTIAILGNGLEAIYPKKNAQLAESILSAGGAVISEQSFGAPAIPRNLVQRDRLQSGMSAGTIVIQTDIIGGSMHTVRFTLLQGRLLFAPVPTGQHLDEPKSKGILALTRSPGRDLATALGAEGEYAELLTQTYGDRPVATSIAGREDYDRMLALLEQAVTGDGQLERARGKPQLGLF